MPQTEPQTERSDYPLPLCRLAEIEDGEGKSLEVHDGTQVRELVVLRQGRAVYGYLNACPHLGVPLEMRPDRFMNARGSHVICRTHGALFRPHDGYCVSGPCVGQALTPIAVALDAAERVVLIAPLPPPPDQARARRRRELRRRFLPMVVNRRPSATGPRSAEGCAPQRDRPPEEESNAPGPSRAARQAATRPIEGARPQMSSTFPVPDEIAENAWVDAAGYQRMYEQSVADPEAFWAEQGKRIHWFKPYSQVKDVSYAPDDVHIRWFHDGTTNAAYNCIDRHLDTKRNDTAIIWEGDSPQEHKHITYGELYEEVCRLANALKANGVKKGDRVTIYLPMIPEAAYAMLACARIGAIHSVVFGGFSPDALAGRIQDCESSFVITSDEGVRGGRKIPLKANTDKALASCPGVEKVLVVRRTGGAIDWVDGRDLWYHEELGKVSDDCPAEEMNAEDPLFILYTS
ncbi:acsA, partial [Symbiodinium necroappetens]